ncbi:MAG: acyl carrier protein [bacterium]|nr:acyl carrier protein [bacterium]
MTELATLKEQIKQLIVDRLKLDVEPAAIEDSQPLFGDEGLGLDSIDALELVLGVEQQFGVRIDDEEIGTQALASVDALAEFVVSKRQPAS